MINKEIHATGTVQGRITGRNGCVEIEQISIETYPSGTGWIIGISKARKVQINGGFSLDNAGEFVELCREVVRQADLTP